MSITITITLAWQNSITIISKVVINHNYLQLQITITHPCLVVNVHFFILVWLTLLLVLVTEQVVGEGGGVGQALEGGVEEAGVAHVDEPAPHPVALLPVQLHPVGPVQHQLGGRDAVRLGALCLAAHLGCGQEISNKSLWLLVTAGCYISFYHHLPIRAGKVHI